jgi:hypothetical protein
VDVCMIVSRFKLAFCADRIRDVCGNATCDRRLHHITFKNTCLLHASGSHMHYGTFPKNIPSRDKMGQNLNKPCGTLRCVDLLLFITEQQGCSAVQRRTCLARL